MLAAPEVQQQLDDNFFLVRMDQLTPAEKQYLHKMGVKVESVAPRRSALIRKGMVFSPAHGDAAFTVPLFDDCLRRTAVGSRADPSP